MGILKKSVPAPRPQQGSESKSQVQPKVDSGPSPKTNSSTGVYTNEIPKEPYMLQGDILESELAELPSTPSPADYALLVRKYNSPKDWQRITDHAKNKHEKKNLSSLEYIQVLVNIVGSTAGTSKDKGELAHQVAKEIEARLEAVSPSQNQADVLPLLTQTVKVAAGLANFKDIQFNLFATIKATAYKVGAFSQVDFAKQFISEYVKLPDIAPVQAVEDVLTAVETPALKLEILFEAIPSLEPNPANNLVWKSLVILREANPSEEVKKQILMRLLDLCRRQGLLKDRKLCRELTLALVDVAEFKGAKQALSENVALSGAIALETSDKAPGFALYALKRGLTFDKSLFYSPQHAQILGNVTTKLATFSPKMAQQVWQQAVKMAEEIALEGTVKGRKRSDFYIQSRPRLNANVIDPATIRFGTGRSNPIAVRIGLEAGFHPFGSAKEQQFVAGLADMLRLSPDDVSILAKGSGGTVYVLYLEPQAVSYTLKSKFERKDKDFQRFQQKIDTLVESVEIILATPEQVAAARKPIISEDQIVEIELERGAADRQATVRVRLPNGAEEKAEIDLPFDRAQLTTLLKVLEQKSLDDHRNWKPSQIEALYRLGLIDRFVLSPEFLPKVKIYFEQAFSSGKFSRLRQSFEWRRWLVILKALLARSPQWDPAQIGILWQMQLLDKVSLTPDYLETIGDMIYDCGLASDEKIYRLLQASLEKAKREAVAWQLDIESRDTYLGRYPWELMGSEHRHFLLNDSLKLDLARSVPLSREATPLTLSLPLNILYIESRPPGPKALPNTQRRIITEALQDAVNNELVNLDTLSTSQADPLLSSLTYADLVEKLEAKDYHIIHFDGHSLFGRQCPQCEKLYDSHYEVCEKGCQARLDKPLGFLQFEDLFKQREWVNSDDLQYLLDQSSLRLVVLSSCFAGSIYGEPMFSGVAPTLLDKGIPCVVGMQFPIHDNDANTFMQAFYKSLAKTGNVRKAMQAGRQALIRAKSWYVPVLYFRSLDATGQLFSSKT